MRETLPFGNMAIVEDDAILIALRFPERHDRSSWPLGLN